MVSTQESFRAIVTNNSTITNINQHKPQDASAGIRSQYKDKGFVLLRDQIPYAPIDDLMAKFCGLVEQVSGRRISDPSGPEMADFLNSHRFLQTRIYDEMRKSDWLTRFSTHSSVTGPVKDLLEPSLVALFSKVIFRTDAPRETSELAVWHQDYYYVKGNTDVITAWIPMRDPLFAQGCLMVMPESHKLGPLTHDNIVLDKRHFPSGIFDREVRYIEMKKGDVLLFHSCLLHSSGVKVSDVCRFSIQARYTRAEDPVDASMGALINV